MSYLDTPAEAGGTNYEKLFALRPDVLDAWFQLNTVIKDGMDLLRYELVTLAAAGRLRSSYCALAHGTVLRDRFYDGDQVKRIVTDRHSSGLDATEVAIMDFADKVARDAASITAEDIGILRAHGLDDTDILQVALAAAARSFISKVLDATGTRPDQKYRTSLEPGLRDALTVGRPIS
jgi:uncharacterized peroxidase-related enzyme